MNVIGLTGGPGMGKSSAAAFLEAQGLPVIDTDQLARELVRRGQPALDEVVAAFGNSVLADSGDLNRSVLAEVVFADPRARVRLQDILHPRIRAAWAQQVETWTGEGHKAAVVVIPLLFETRAESDLNSIICVACSRSTQMKRLLERGWSPEHAQQRIDAQWPVERKMAKSDYVVWTEGPLEVSHQQLHRILRHV